MMNLNLKYSSQRKPTPRELLDELVRSGYRPYICGDPGYGVVIVWAKTRYVYKEGEGGLCPDEEATISVLSKFLECDNVRPRPITPALEALLSSSVRAITTDFGDLVFRPLVLTF